VLTSSDIIESVFGKYKNFVAKGPLKEIGRLVLTIPAFISNNNGNKIIKKAIDKVGMKDVKDWLENRQGKSMLAKRRQALKIAPKAPIKDIKTV